SVLVSWTSPGDDNAAGTAASYDLRFSTSAITAGNFGSATPVTGEPAPAVAGTAQSMTVSGLTAGTTYFFAMKTSDEVPNVSPISNVPTGSTLVTPDTTPPAAVVSLSLGTWTQTSVLASWTAPGDDNAVGTAATYDLRFSTSAITAANFASAAPVTGEPAPAVAGTAQSMTVSGLTAGTTYFFAMKTSDEVPNVSPISNVPTGSTLVTPDTTPPAAIANLALGTWTQSSVLVSWTSPGDDNAVGTAVSYDLRFSTSAITAGNFGSATPVAGEPAPAVAGTAQSMTISGLAAGTNYFFAIKTSDEVPNVSTVSNVPTGSTLVIPDTTPPAAIANLSLGSWTQTSVLASWTSPGDDNAAGTATSFDLRFSTSAITAANFGSATPVAGEPVPAVAGTTQSMTVSGLAAGTSYFFAIKTSDEVPNTSAISNVPTGSTLVTPDTTPPAAIANLALSTWTQTSVLVGWTSPGDDNAVGTAASYDLRFSTSAITAANFGTAW
ncbi:MAG: Ig-like domain-containing protein, partial [bacterium]